jgi:hypothetical protein
LEVRRLAADLDQKDTELSNLDLRKSEMERKVQVLEVGVCAFCSVFAPKIC